MTYPVLQESRNLPASRVWPVFIVLMLLCTAGYTQTASVQVKVSDNDLTPMGDLSLSLNGGPFFTTNKKGIAFIEVKSSDLPPASVQIKHEKIEAESWNYSRGVLEVIVREKKNTTVKIYVRDAQEELLGNVIVHYEGSRRFQPVYDHDGYLFTLPLGEDIRDDQFSISGYEVTRVVRSAGARTLIVAPRRDKSRVQNDASLYANFNFSNLDTVRTWQKFYKILRHINSEELTARERQLLDAKFAQLSKQAGDNSSVVPAEQYIARISDSSQVKDDIRNLLAHADREKDAIDKMDAVFNEKMKLLSRKLEGGTGKLDEKARTSLVSEIDKLELALDQHEQRVLDSQSNYRLILGTLKRQLLNVKDLEDRLSVLEEQRLQERYEFQKRIAIIIGIVFVLLLLIVLFVYLIQKLRKQRTELIDAHCAIRLVNDNLEDLVQQRTLSLARTNEEMDTFFYKASHNLRRPLRSIIGLSNIGKSTDASDVRELFDRTSITAHDMDHLLMRLQRISEINYPSDFSTIRLRTLIEEVHAQIQKAFVFQVRFLCECPDDVVFESYPHVLQSILQGLLENAFTFASLGIAEPATVRLKAWCDSNTLRLEVEDNGVGIDPAIADQVFNMFFVGHEGSKGDGLGLYIVKKGVDSLGGQIVVDSQVNRYTRFSLWISLSKNMTLRDEQHALMLP